MVEGLIAIGVVLILNILILAFGYGKLTQKVASLANDTSHIVKNIENIFRRIDDINERLSRLEGRLEALDEKKAE